MRRFWGSTGRVDMNKYWDHLTVILNINCLSYSVCRRLWTYQGWQLQKESSSRRWGSSDRHSGYSRTGGLCCYQRQLFPQWGRVSSSLLNYRAWIFHSNSRVSVSSFYPMQWGLSSSYIAQTTLFKSYNSSSFCLLPFINKTGNPTILLSVAGNVNPGIQPLALVVFVPATYEYIAPAATSGK